MAARDRLAHWLSVTLGRYFVRKAGAPLDPADLRQKACMAVLDNLHAFEDRGEGSFGRWVRGVAYRRMLQERAAHKREAAGRSALADHPRKPASSLDSRITSGELQEQVRVALGSLSEIQRTAVLCEFEERDDAVVAREHKMSVRAFRMHRSRGRALLARQTQKMRKTPLPRVSWPRVKEGSTPKET